MTLEEERILVEKTKKNKQNFKYIYDYYSKKIYSYIYRRMGNKELSEDLASITFEKALNKFDDFRWQGVSMGVWLYRIARNNINDYLRKIRNRNRDVSLTDLESYIKDEVSDSLEDIVIRDEEEQMLYNAIQQFSEEDQFLIY